MRGPMGPSERRLPGISARRGGMGLIRRCGILPMRLELREEAEDIGFRT